MHVGQDDVPVAHARELAGAEVLVGLSTHSPQQVDAAHAAQADYLGVGPVHATPTKPGRPPVGLDLVHYAAANATLPWFAIGGIDEHTIHSVLAAGATRVAVVRCVAEAADPHAAARTLGADPRPAGGGPWGVVAASAPRGAPPGARPRPRPRRSAGSAARSATR